MPVELIKEPLMLNTGFKKESAQVIKEQDIIVSDGKPDIKKIIEIDGRVEIDQIEVQKDRIVYKGKIELEILYVPENNAAGICIMNFAIPLEDFVVVEGIDKEQNVKLSYDIEHLHWNVLNERKLNVKVILQLGSNASWEEEVEVLVACNSEEEVQVQNKDIDIYQKGDIKEEKIIIKEDLSIPAGKSNIQEILKNEITISDKEIKRGEEEIYYSGNLNIATLYKPQDNEDDIEIVNHQIPFNSAVEYMTGDDESHYACTLGISGQYINVIPDIDGEDRIIEIELVVKAQASNICYKTNKIIDDVYCPGKSIEIEDSQKHYMDLLHKDTLCTSKQETVILEDSSPDNEEIYSVNMKAKIEDVKMDTDKITISGIIDTKIIYITQNEYQKLSYMNTLIPFTQEVFIEGIDEKSKHSINSNIENIELVSQGKKDIVIEFDICSDIEVYKKQSLCLIEEIILTDFDKEDIEKMPSMIVYTVKKDDTYWCIAKRYNTTLEELAKLNDIDVNEVLYPGTKLMILKKSNY